MGPIPWETVVGMAVFFASFVYVATKSPSLYFGLSILCLFMVSSASLAGVTHGLVFGLPLAWVTPSHLEVIQYSIIGSLAMVAGLAMAWFSKPPRALGSGGGARIAAGPAGSSWINATFGWFVFSVGSVASLVEGALHNVATISTAVHSLADFTTVGVLVLLAASLKQRSYRQLATMLAVYAPIVLMRAFATGHTPAKVSLLLPAMCIVIGFRKLKWRSIVVVAVCAFVFLTAMSGWLATRDTIRAGRLAGLSFTEKVQRFVPEWFDASLQSAFDVQAANATIRDRVDMTSILAMQVRHQPTYEPYAYGGTVLDATVALVPRALWPGKPVIAGGSAFVSRYTGMRRDPRDTTSIGLPYQFELYANGGPLAVVVGLFLVGYACGAMERRLFEPTASLGSLLARISITMTLCGGGQRTDVVLPSLVAGGLTYLALGKLIESANPAFAAKLLGTRSAPTTRPSR